MFGKLFKADTPAKNSTEDAPVASSDWEVNLGPLSVGSKGLDLRPQMKVGAQGKNLNAEFGIGDIRDGLKLSAKAEAMVEAQAEGYSLRELHESIHCDTAGFRQALEKAKELLEKHGPRPDAGSKTISDIAGTLGLDREKVEAVLSGRARVEGHPLQLNVKAAVGVGAYAKVCLGWTDTAGYKMVGVGGAARAGLALQANVFAGKHASGATAKIILGIGTFTFEYVLPLPASMGGAAASGYVSASPSAPAQPPVAAAASVPAAAPVAAAPTPVAPSPAQAQADLLDLDPLPAESGSSTPAGGGASTEAQPSGAAQQSLLD